MKNSNYALVMLLFFATIFNAVAQRVIPGNSYKLSPFVKGADYISNDYKEMHKIHGFRLVNNTIEVYSQSQRFGLIMSEVLSNGNKYSPIFQVTSFDLASDESKLNSYPIHISDFTGKDKKYNILDAYTKKNVGSEGTDTKLGELKSKFPNAFPSQSYTASKSEEPYLDILPKFSSYDIEEVTQHVNLDSLYISGKWSYNKTERPLKSETPKFEGEECKSLLWGDKVYNKEAKTLTFAVGALRRELKKQQYKEIAYGTVNHKGELLNQCIVKFDYTKEHWFYDLAQNLDSNKKQVVAVLGNRGMMGKNNDPVKGKYNLVVLNTEGDLYFTKEFSFGEKSIEFNPIASFIKNEKVYLISLNNVNPEVDMFIFDKSGEMEIKSLGSSALWAMTYSNVPNSNNLGMNFLAGKPNYSVLGMYALENGNQMLLFDSYTKQSVSVPNTSTTTTGFNSVIEFHYKAIVGLELSSNMEIKGQYIINKQFTNDNAATVIEDLLVVKNKIVLLSVDKVFAVKEIFKQNYVDNDEYLNIGCQEQCKPVLMVLDTDNKKATKLTPTESNFVTLFGTGSYVLQKEKNTVIYVGMKDGLPQNQVEMQACKFEY